MPKTRPLEERFWEKVEVKGPDECWEWRGAKLKKGYGRIWKNGKLEQAHRVSWEIHNGPIPKGKQVLHHYDNPSCMNPRHLWLGSNADNIRDRDGKDRQPRGEALGNSKLTEQDVHEIRIMIDAGYSQKVIAYKYNISRPAVSNIKTGKSWGWLKKG